MSLSVSGIAPIGSTEWICYQCMQIARSTAQHYHLNVDEAQEFALCFTEHILAKRELLPEEPQSLRKYLLASVHKYGINYVRDIFRRRRYEVPLPELETVASCALDFPTSTLSPEAALLQAELDALLTEVLATLDPEIRSFVWEHVCQSEAIVRLAASSPRSYDSVRIAISRALKQMRMELAKRGVGEGMLRDYIANIFSTPPVLSSEVRLPYHRKRNSCEKFKNMFGFGKVWCYRK